MIYETKVMHATTSSFFLNFAKFFKKSANASKMLKENW